MLTLNVEEVFALKDKLEVIYTISEVVLYKIKFFYVETQGIFNDVNKSTKIVKSTFFLKIDRIQHFLSQLIRLSDSRCLDYKTFYYSNRCSIVIS